MFEKFFKLYEKYEIVFVFDDSEYDCDTEEFDYIRHSNYFDIEKVKVLSDEYGVTCCIYLIDNRFPWEKNCSIWEMDNEKEEKADCLDLWDYNGIRQSDFI